MKESTFFGIAIFATWLISCKMNESRSSQLKDNTSGIFVAIGDSKDPNTGTLIVSTPSELSIAICLTKKGEDCSNTQSLLKLDSGIKRGDRFFYQTQELATFSPELDYLVVDSTNRSSLLKFRLIDLRTDLPPGLPQLTMDPSYSIDITGNDTLSDGITPRSRTGALLTPDYMLTCLHNHQKIKMDDTLQESKWWINALGPSLPIFRSPEAVRTNQNADIIVVSQEHFKDLDLALLKIKWVTSVPAEQKFISRIAIGRSIPPVSTEVFSVGFPRDTYMPGRKFAAHRGKFVGPSGPDMTYSDLDIRLGDSGSPVIARGADGIDTLVSLVHATDTGSKNAMGTSLVNLYSQSETLRRLFDSNGNRITR
jgi:Trypsin-like peptidase domain